MTSSVLPIQVIKAPEHWRTVDFISDLHLQENEHATFEVWQRYMQNTTADAVFILGDLFEVWVGDDAVQQHVFLQQCQNILKSTARHKHVGFMRGNRDFLVGPQFLRDCHVHDLQDPTVLSFASESWLISHGDEGCLDDVNYQAFRQMVRTAPWQQNFLSKPLAEREVIARQLRTESELRKKESTSEYADVDDAWALQLLMQTQSSCLVHGHTHKPANHVLGAPQNLKRIVLSDWDAVGVRPRAEVLRRHASGKVDRVNLLR